MIDQDFKDSLPDTQIPESEITFSTQVNCPECGQQVIQATLSNGVLYRLDADRVLHLKRCGRTVEKITNPAETKYADLMKFRAIESDNVQLLKTKLKAAEAERDEAKAVIVDALEAQDPDFRGAFMRSVEIQNLEFRNAMIQKELTETTAFLGEWQKAQVCDNCGDKTNENYLVLNSSFIEMLKAHTASQIEYRRKLIQENQELKQQIERINCQIDSYSKLLNRKAEWIKNLSTENKTLQDKVTEFALLFINAVSHEPIQEGFLTGYFPFVRGIKHHPVSKYLCELGLLERHETRIDFYRWIKETKVEREEA